MILCYEFYASSVISKPRYFELYSVSLGLLNSGNQLYPRVNLIKLLQVYLLFSDSKTMATIKNYTSKSFIKLTSDRLVQIRVPTGVTVLCSLVRQLTVT